MLDNPTLRDLQRNYVRVDPMGPMPALADIQAHLAMAGQQYPALYPVNPAAWDAAVQSWPQSLNIEDRRPMRHTGRYFR